MIYQVFSPQIWLDLQSGSDGLFSAEENATFWLWAYPSLLGWPRKFEWLFSPVVGNTTYPGDLWGVDEVGNLILVETKRGQNSDPFEDFIQFEAGRLWEAEGYWQELAKKWEYLFGEEQHFWQDHKADLNKEVTARGIVPYSSKRYETRQWSKLYSDMIAPRLVEECKYREHVSQFLSACAQNDKRKIYYIGLVYVKEPGALKLSSKGTEHLHRLEDLAGVERVTLMWLTASESQTSHTVELQSERS